MKKKKFRGYIFSREFMGERVPQNVQNLFIRDFCNKKNFQYLLSATEYAMESSSMVLAQAINDLKKIDGIVAYSVFQLPSKKQKRIEYLQKIINLKKTFYGALEDLKVYDELSSDHPIDLTRYQVANSYFGRVGLINSGGASGDNDLQDAVATAVINKRAGGMGLISGRKAFQKPLNDGIELLNAIQDVYLNPDITIA